MIWSMGLWTMGFVGVMGGFALLEALAWCIARKRRAREARQARERIADMESFVDPEERRRQLLGWHHGEPFEGRTTTWIFRGHAEQPRQFYLWAHNHPAVRSSHRCRSSTIQHTMIRIPPEYWAVRSTTPSGLREAFPRGDHAAT